MMTVRIVAPVSVAHAAYARLISLARDKLGCDEVPAKGSLLWEGEGTPDVSMFPASMPGQAERLLHDRQLGVFVGDSRPESIAAIKSALSDKLASKATLIDRLAILSDPQIQLQLLRSCASTRPDRVLDAYHAP